MDFLSEELQKYVEDHTAPESELLKQLNRETHAHVMMPRMLSGHVQGRVLAAFSHMIKPHNVLEIGTYTGYSAICLAEGLSKDGKLYTIDINEELEEMVKDYFVKAGVSDKIEYLIGNAVDLIPALKVQFDLVFIDADKINYSNYFDLVIDKVTAGGFIVADNVLWSGKVVNQDKADKDTQALLDFNRKVHNDTRVENVLFPVRDGLMVMRKIAD
ncbi:O-methyltransferase [Fulvivirga imtechensis AK7]|uniref:O-methyltransferase n=1 Tax=Fulvivirga imtechensis AK7 TaxID=1237149 RepID=L8JSG4_9BACT|nr:O-methyltransferase [Fulvivirga imtechensis]ELR70434.1 O-methyltransferase [Fulvivirga imtechensis AK7]